MEDSGGQCIVGADRDPMMLARDKVRFALSLFPRGLYQPAGSFRFSADALLLASFINGRRGALVADLGAGCGIVGLAYLLRNPEAWAIGFENQTELVAAANQNASLLGCGERYTCLNVNLTCPESMKADFFERAVRKSTGINKQLMLENMPAETADESFLEPSAAAVAKACAMAGNKGGFDVVLSNPPYRVLGRGRLPLSVMRQKALFAPPGTVEQFLAAAFTLSAPQGCLGVVFPGCQESWIRKTIVRSGFELERVLRVHGREGKPATLVLLQGRKVQDGKPPADSSRIETPLVLYDKANKLTESAVRFCPYLG